MFPKGFGSQNAKFPARFARRKPSFPYGSQGFGPPNPQKIAGALRAPEAFISLCFQGCWSPKSQNFAGALRAPETFISLCFARFLDPQIPKFCRRASRAGNFHFPYVAQGLGTPKPQNFAGAPRAPETFISLPFSKVCGPQNPKLFRRA